MIDFERGLYVRISELTNGPRPFPLQSGFSDNVAYRVIGIYNPSESGECWFVLANDLDQMWFISQRHLRVDRIRQDGTDMRYALGADPQSIPERRDLRVA